MEAMEESGAGHLTPGLAPVLQATLLCPTESKGEAP